MKGNRKIAVSALLSLAAAAWFTGPVYADDQKIRRVLVISIDGMHALDLALWVKNNPNSALGQIAARGMNYTNASTMKPSDSIPSTAGIFTGGTPAVTGMYYDDAYNRAWFAPANTNCTGAPGSVIDLKQGIASKSDLVRRLQVGEVPGHPRSRLEGLRIAQPLFNPVRPETRAGQRKVGSGFFQNTARCGAIVRRSTKSFGSKSGQDVAGSSWH